MSDATKAALDAAIEAHLADETPGAILAGYVLKIEGRTVDGIDRGYSNTRWEIPDTQSTIMTIGLATALHQDILAWYNNELAEEDDDN